MSKNKLIAIIVISVSVCVFLLLGTTFALFSKTLKGDKTVSIESGTLKIDFEEGDTINLEDTGTLSDAEGLESNPYTFTITNSGDIKAYYTVSFQEDSDNNTLDTSFVKYKLTSDKGYDSGIKVMKEVGSGTFLVKDEDTLGTSTDDKKVTYTLRLWLSDTADNTAQGKMYKMKVLVKGYSNEGGSEIDKPKQKLGVETLLAEYTNDESIQEYDVNYTKEDASAKENKMYVFNHTAGAQQQGWSPDELKSYRYIGANPNNYVTFNNEIAGWRIIGIETVDNGSGTKEKRIKLIKNDPLPVGTNNYISFDNKPSGTGSSESSYGSNDWTDSRLMMVLNPGYDSDPLATGGKGSLYWNRQSGSCPLGSSDGTTSCDFTSTGLKEEAQKLIGDAKWYLGGTENYDSAETGTPNHFYGYERGEETCTTTGSCTKERKTNWTGKIGLMYPSDYGYATSGGTSKTRDTCLSDTVYNYDAEDCKNNDWLFINGTYQWTIAPYSGYSSNVFIVDTGGFVRRYNVAGSDTVARPVVYLTSNIQLLKGTGAVDDPFEFGL